MTPAELLRRSFTAEECEVREATQADLVSGAPRACVALPSSPKVLSEIVQLAVREGLKLLPAGNRHHLHLGNLPDRVDVLVSSSKLTTVFHYEPADLTASAAAGVTLGQLAELTHSHRQFLPLDPPNDERATLGGVISANLFGQLRTAYGAARDYVVGAKFVRGDGSIVKSGGRVVKNVAGYDLHKLLIGSYGTLGIVTEVSLKLQPMPEHELTVLAQADGAPLSSLLRDLNRSAVSPMSAALLNRESARSVSADFTAGEYAILIRFGDTAAANRYQAEKFIALCRNSGAAAVDEIPEPTAASVWFRLKNIENSIEPAITLRARVLPSECVATISMLKSILDPIDSRTALAVMPAVGVIWVGVRRPVEKESDVGQWTSVLSQMRSDLRARRGSLVVEGAPLRLKRAIDVWGEKGAEGHLMERIRRTFDPEGIFIPERLFKRESAENGSVGR